MNDPSLLEVSHAHALHGNISALRTQLNSLSASLNLSSRIVELLLVAAENEWCPIATLNSAGQLQLMSTWQIFTLFSTIGTDFFPVVVHSLAESSGYAVIHRFNGNCVIGDPDGKVDIQVISPLDGGFVNLVTGRSTSSILSDRA